jgi:hypothetical protein
MGWGERVKYIPAQKRERLRGGAAAAGGGEVVGVEGKVEWGERVVVW